MATIHISEANATNDFVGLISRVSAGAEVVVENGAHSVAEIHTPAPPHCSISECIALLPEDSPAAIDGDFAHGAEGAFLSEKASRVATEEIFAGFDTAGGAEFVIYRDLSLPIDRGTL